MVRNIFYLRILNHPVKNSLNFRHPSKGGELYIFNSSSYYSVGMIM